MNHKSHVPKADARGNVVRKKDTHLIEEKSQGRFKWYLRMEKV